VQHVDVARREELGVAELEGPAMPARKTREEVVDLRDESVRSKVRAASA